MLKVEHISTGYGKKQVLFDVSFEVKKGDIAVLIGANGSGKSTLLKAIFGVLPPWRVSGLSTSMGRSSIHFNGEDMTGVAASEMLRRGLLYIPQKNNLFEQLTVRENFEMAGLTLGRTLLRDRIDRALSNFPLLIPLLKRVPMKLSGGERQILALAMATLHNPKMILMDEPLSGLSIRYVRLILNTIPLLNVTEEVTFLMVEHRIREAATIARYLIGLRLGRVAGTFSAGEVLSNAALWEVFT